MGRGVQADQLANSGTANKLSSGYNQNAEDTFGVLSPALTQEVQNPQGFAPEDLTAMNTASQQSLGGSQAGAVGAGNLRAARTRNAGGGDAAIAESARQGMRQNSQNAVTIQANNALEREKNRQAGISGEEGLFGENSDATLKALGLSNNALQGAAGSKNGFFDVFGNAYGAALGKTLGSPVPGIGGE